MSKDSIRQLMSLRVKIVYGKGTQLFAKMRPCNVTNLLVRLVYHSGRRPGRKV